MIQITPQMRILVAVEAVDGRKGIDSLARLCQEKLQADPFSGGLFVFRRRAGDLDPHLRACLKSRKQKTGQMFRGVL